MRNQGKAGFVKKSTGTNPRRKTCGLAHGGGTTNMSLSLGRSNVDREQAALIERLRKQLQET
jgi:hypothetical protein